MAPVHSTPETDETEGFAISNSERGLPESLCAVPVPSDSSRKTKRHRSFPCNAVSAMRVKLGIN